MNIYLFFNGNCEDAMNFYSQATGGSIDAINRFGDTPVPGNDSYKDKVMHGIMTINGATVMFSDSSEKRVVNFGDNFSMALDYKDETEMQQAFDALSTGGKLLCHCRIPFGEQNLACAWINLV